MSVMPNQRFSMNGVKEAGTNSGEGLKLNYYKSVRVIFGVRIILNTKVTMIEIKHYQLKNILIKLEHI